MEVLDAKLLREKPSNIFGLRYPEQWGCHIEEYKKGLGQLKIVLVNLESHKTLRVHFSSVDYYEGPLHWVGANFCIADDEECFKILRRSDSSSETSLQNLLKSYVLVTVDNPLYQVKFLAHKTSIAKQEK